MVWGGGWRPLPSLPQWYIRPCQGTFSILCLKSDLNWRWVKKTKTNQAKKRIRYFLKDFLADLLYFLNRPILQLTLNFMLSLRETNMSQIWEQKYRKTTATLLKKRLWQWFFPENFANFSRIPFLQNSSGRLLLKVIFIFNLLTHYS